MRSILAIFHHFLPIASLKKAVVNKKCATENKKLTRIGGIF